ncbi:MAG: DUF4070 domain-containing protein [Myxococcales bacterium]|nr:DUF4070 domain-containing protein [Myxococcales bacterium]
MMTDKRRILLIYPKFTRSHLLNYEFMAPFYPGKRGVMPPTGLLVIAGLFEGDGWEVRIADENVEPFKPADLAWAEVVGLSGMHQQRVRLIELIDLCNRSGKITVVGGSSVNICPEYYPQADVLHVGELGDGTKELLAFLRTATAKPPAQVVFQTKEKATLDEQPLPALHLIDVNGYLLVPVQFSVGCPFTCEFCDIPMIYGRVARLKSPARVMKELDALYDRGFIGAVMFVDDNLIANRKALREFLPELIAWQKARGFPFQFTSEASVNLARDKEILELLRLARFTTMFVGVESPDPTTLIQISKKQNVMDPILDSLRAIEEHGIEVLIGIIFGFDSDTPETGRMVARFIDQANAPIIHFNMLAALPKTPLWERMVREGRLVADDDHLQMDNLLGCLNSNVKMKLPNAVIKQMLIETMRDAYSPEKVWARYTWNLEHVYGRQVAGRPPSKTWTHLKILFPFAVKAMRNVLRVGVREDYRRLFWRFVWQAVRLRVRGKIPSLLDVLFKVVPTAHHLIRWSERYLAQFAEVPVRAVEAPSEPHQMAVGS